MNVNCDKNLMIFSIVATGSVTNFFGINSDLEQVCVRGKVIGSSLLTLREHILQLV